MKLIQRKCLHLVAVWLLGSLASSAAAAEHRPSFCAAVPDNALGGLAAPYAAKTAPNGSTYCEGLLPNPIAFPAPRVISAKREGPNAPVFAAGALATLSWCDQGRQPVYIRLRSTKPPLYALDAVATGQFQWQGDEISQWQPQWNNIASLASRHVNVAGKDYEVLLPLSSASSGSTTYVFLLQSINALHFDNALIESLAADAKPMLINVKTESGSTRNTWLVRLPFAARPKGIYRVTLEESVDLAGISAQPVYLLHEDCH